MKREMKMEMKMEMKPTLAVLAVLAIALGASVAQGQVNVPSTVTVGDAGNASLVDYNGGVTTYGDVSYVYKMGTYEVTNTEYTEFLNAVAASDPNSLYNPLMGTEVDSGINRLGSDGGYTYSVKTNFDNKPVNYVSVYDAMRYTNWLNTGATESGMYTMTGPTTYASADRQLTAGYALPTEDEWMKAAFYDPRTAAEGGPGNQANYWDYANQSDYNHDGPDPDPEGVSYPVTPAIADSTGDCTNPSVTTINCGAGYWPPTYSNNWNGSTDGNVLNVGSCEAPSYYGTQDQSGNLYEWVIDTDDGDGTYIRGGGFDDGDRYGTLTSWRAGCRTAWETEVFDVGFRVSELLEPLPPLPGDTDLDDNVDLDDFNVLKNNFESGSGRTWAEGDFTGDGEVKLDDFVLLKNNFTGGAAVPEPATLSLLAIATCLPLRRRRR